MCKLILWITCCKADTLGFECFCLCQDTELDISIRATLLQWNHLFFHCTLGYKVQESHVSLWIFGPACAQFSAFSRHAISAFLTLVPLMERINFNKMLSVVESVSNFPLSWKTSPSHIFSSWQSYSCVKSLNSYGFFSFSEQQGGLGFNFCSWFKSRLWFLSCGVWMFSLYLCGLSSGTLTSSHSLKTCILEFTGDSNWYEHVWLSHLFLWWKDKMSRTT